MIRSQTGTWQFSLIYTGQVCVCLAQRALTVQRKNNRRAWILHMLSRQWKKRIKQGLKQSTHLIHSSAEGSNGEDAEAQHEIQREREMVKQTYP